MDWPLTSDPAHAPAARSLEWTLSPIWPGLRCAWVESITSTNTVLVDEARGARFMPTLLVADEQTAGKGRLGRSWQSRPGRSLTFSMALPLDGVDWSGLSLAIGVALAESLSSQLLASDRCEPGLRLRLKWPNDLWLVDADDTGRKLAGILIESVNSRSHGKVAVIGAGINLLPRPEADSALTTGYASVSEFWPDTTLSAVEVLHVVAPAMLQAVHLFGREGFGAFGDRFKAFDLLEGRTVHTRATAMAGSTSEPHAVGVAAGIDGQGALLIRTASGLQSVSSGEISVRLGDGREPSDATRSPQAGRGA